MNDALLMCRFERLGDLSGDRQRLIDGNRTSTDSLCERLSLHEFHHEGSCAVRFLEAVNGRDVWVIQGRQDFSFTLEACELF
mgnify:CR=1 FL=1